MPAWRPLADRFWEKVNKDGPVPAHCPELGPCWLWTASTNKAGYGKIGSGAGGPAEQTLLAPRVAWELTNDPIPAGLLALHHCDNPPCVNPAHLFLGTSRDNTQDMIAKGRRVQASGSPETRARAAAARAKTVWLRDPSGKPIQVTNLNKFCRENALDQGGMWRVIAGRRPSFKGYTAYECPSQGESGDGNDSAL